MTLRPLWADLAVPLCDYKGSLFLYHEGIFAFFTSAGILLYYINKFMAQICSTASNLFPTPPSLRRSVSLVIFEFQPNFHLLL